MNYESRYSMYSVAMEACFIALCRQHCPHLSLISYLNSSFKERNCLCSWSRSSFSLWQTACWAVNSVLSSAFSCFKSTSSLDSICDSAVEYPVPHLTHKPFPLPLSSSIFAATWTAKRNSLHHNMAAFVVRSTARRSGM